MENQTVKKKMRRRREEEELKKKRKKKKKWKEKITKKSFCAVILLCEHGRSGGSVGCVGKDESCH